MNGQKVRLRLSSTTWFSENKTRLETALHWKLRCVLDARIGSSVSYVTSLQAIANSLVSLYPVLIISVVLFYPFVGFCFSCVIKVLLPASGFYFMRLVLWHKHAYYPSQFISCCKTCEMCFRCSLNLLLWEILQNWCNCRTNCCNDLRQKCGGT